jgi:hypothetical protein
LGEENQALSRNELAFLMDETILLFKGFDQVFSRNKSRHFQRMK